MCKIREIEMDLIFWIYAVWFVLSACVDSLPAVMPIVVFFVYISYGNDLKPSNAFTVLSLFFVIIIPVQQITGFVTQLKYAEAGLDRLQSFFELEEVEPYVNSNNETNKHVDGTIDDCVIVFKKASFGWLRQQDKDELERLEKEALQAENKDRGDGKSMKKEKEKDEKGMADGDNEGNYEMVPVAATDVALEGDAEKEEKTLIDRTIKTLVDINAKIQRGQLVAIVGPVGCGKSSFLAALLNDMYCTSGSVSMRGKISYHQQQPWILNTTVQVSIHHSYTSSFLLLKYMY